MDAFLVFQCSSLFLVGSICLSLFDICIYFIVYTYYIILHYISSYTHVYINPRSLLSCTNTHFGVGLNEPSTLSRQQKVMMLLLMMMC